MTTPTLETKYVFTLTVRIGDVVTAGETGIGVRRIIPIIGGEVKGAISGKVLPFGADFQTIRPNELIDLEAKYAFETDDGATVYVENKGMVDTRATFYIPSTYGDWITIETKIESIKRSSFEVKHNVYKGEALALEGFETRVLVGRDPVNPDKLKSAPFPAEMVAKFTGS